MGAPLDNQRRTSAFSANQQVKPQGMVLPWLMTMPSPNEAMNIGTRPDEKRDPEGRSRATQLMPMPDGPGSASPALTSTRIILVACIFTASVLCIWNTGLKPFPDFPNATEMASPAASVSSKQGLEGMRAPDVEADAWMTPISPTPARPELDRESISQLQPGRQDVQPQRITDTPHVAFLPLPQGVPQSTGAKGGITAESRAEPGITKPTCYASASAVSQDYPEAWPSWTLRALGHEGTKCWYPTTRTLAHDHPK